MLLNKTTSLKLRYKMKHYVIRETSGYNTIVRNGKTTPIGLGEQFTEAELATLACDTPTTYLCLTTSTVHTYGGELPVAAPTVEAVVETPVVEEVPAEGMTPSSMETGSEASEA